MTHVRQKRFVACPFSAALELAEKAARQRSGLYLTPVPPLGERARFAVESIPDTTDDSRKHEALLIAWRPQTRGMFPDFHGVLTVRPRYSGVALQLVGQYEPPYGVIGKMFDVLAGRSIARNTLRRLLADFADDIEREYAAERLAHQPAS